MPSLTFLALLFALLYFVKSKQQFARIALLSTYLGRYRLEKLMEDLTEGYLRALDEKDNERQAPLWNHLEQKELQLLDQLQRLAQDFAQEQSRLVQVGKWPIYLPFATQLMPAACFDMRQALQLHAASVARAMAAPPSPSHRDRAYRICAELFLFQHSCHWFCRSKTTASARLLARHQTGYAQVLASVAPETRTPYLKLTSL
jgi:hypothetical protein